MRYSNSLLLFLGLITVSANVLAAAPANGRSRAPNIVLILCDNLGYGDIGPFGSTLHRTPHLDRFAAEGMKLTHFYVSSGVCTASRASLITGSYPRRVSMHKNVRNGPVLQPIEPIGLHPDEVTIAEVLKDRGYATALIGKWHLGDQSVFLPTRQGFDAFFGIPYSEDMTPREGEKWPPLPLMRNETVIEAPVDRALLTQRYTAETIRFITDQRERPFFVLLSHAMPGSTRTPFSSPAFTGRSRNGAYGDCIEEIDWSTGEIMGALKRLGLDDSTLVIWTSDNGAVLRSPPLGGSNLPLSGWMHSIDEGGMRVPCLVRWPGRVPRGSVCAELSTTMDLLPTFAVLADGQPPRDRKIDGKNIWPLLAGERGAKSPHEAFYYYQFEQLQAVRAGEWKLFVPLERRRVGSHVPLENVSTPVRLYNVVSDPGEKSNVAAHEPAIVARLTKLADAARADLGDIDVFGAGQRPAGWVFDPQPVVLPRKQ